ncbi:putative retrotransposon ty1-copia subclass protein, partial [Tanacetum coccineum]
AVHTYKARLAAKGYTQTYGIDYEETFSLVADIKAIRILIAITAFYDYEIWQMDVKTAFLNGYLSGEVYMEQPEVFINPKYPNRHFQRFLGTNEKGIAMNSDNLFTSRLTSEEAAKMVTDVTDKEIKEAMFDIGENKAPDGFTSAFFIPSWNVIGKEVCQAIKEFFCSGKLLGGNKCYLNYIDSENPSAKQGF